MYVGNGITRKFLIPEGYDGSVVVLSMEGGKGIRMAEGIGYFIEGRYVTFSTPVPKGIKVSFNEADATEIMKKNSGAYVVVYADGTIKEVDEDPTLLLEEARKLLADVKQSLKECEQATSDAKKYMTSMLSSSGADLDGRLEGYSQVAQKAVDEAIINAKRELTESWSTTLERLTVDTSTLRLTLEEIQRVKAEVESTASRVGNDVKDEILNECKDLFENIKTLKDIKTVLENEFIKAKENLEKIRLDIYQEVRLKVNEEIEMLRSLRNNMEQDFETLNTKINNRWDLLRSDLK